MQLEFDPGAGAPLRRALGYAEARDVICDRRGRTVRCTPTRRTVRHALAAGAVVYRKHYGDRGARTEWANLLALRAAGFAVAAPVCVAATGGRSAVVFERVPGRAADAVLAAGPGQRGRVRRAIAALAPVVRRLHREGWCHRDLYLGHCFLDEAGDNVVLIDVQRIFQPRWRRRRWRVKDLAALWSSVPAGVSRADGLRFLKLYLNAERGRTGRVLRRGWARAITAKARRIRRHRPKYG